MQRKAAEWRVGEARREEEEEEVAAMERIEQQPARARDEVAARVAAAAELKTKEEFELKYKLLEMKNEQLERRCEQLEQQAVAWRRLWRILQEEALSIGTAASSSSRLGLDDENDDDEAHGQSGGDDDDGRFEQATVAAAAAAPPSMTAVEALRQAEAEELTLQRSENSITGYKGVCFDTRGNKHYQVQMPRAGSRAGRFATAEEAVLVLARALAAESPAKAAAAAAPAPAPPPPMTAEEALRQAEAEGLKLQRSESTNTGYMDVNYSARNSRVKISAYEALVRRGDARVYLGVFETAEEAALVVARDAAAQEVAPQPPATSSRKRFLEEGTFTFPLLNKKQSASDEQLPVGTRIKLEEQPPPMPNDARVKLELVLE